MNQLLIINATIINSDSTIKSDIAVSEGLFKEIGHLNPKDFSDYKIIDVKGKYIFPGGIDPHVHLELPTPAGPSCDDFQSGSKAAIAGGTTFLVDFVTPSHGQSLMKALAFRLKESNKCLVDYTLHMGITWYDETIPEQMEWCVNEVGIKSFKAYLAYKGSIGIEYRELEQVMIKAASLNAIVLVHCEEGDAIIENQKKFLSEGKTEPLYHALSRPAEVESESVWKVIDLCRKTNCKTYIVHTSTAKSIEYIRAAKREGLPLFCETCPQYLLFDESVYSKPLPESLKYVISPPIRSKQDQEALWLAVADGTVDVISTDHCPFNTKGQKDMGISDFTKIPNGAGGIENRLALLYTYGVLTKKISLQRFVGLTSTNAARIFDLYPQKGSIQVGSDADLVIWNPESKSAISVKSQLQKCDSNIYEGLTINGEAEYLVKNGEIL
ncbi:MAG: dihydropyrimidinase [Bacteroidales bacterium]|nr:dihydropyrimidinase [Bacteroidales bacterium]